MAYAESQDTVRWLVEVKGRDVLFSLIAELHAGSNFNTAFETVVGWDLATYDMLWRESLTERYQWASLFSNSYVLWGGFRWTCPYRLSRLLESETTTPK